MRTKSLLGNIKQQLIFQSSSVVYRDNLQKEYLARESADMDEHSSNWLQASSFGETLKRLIQFKKSQHPQVSLAYLCKRASINSRGYLSDVMKGRRRLNPSYIDALIDALGLEAFEGDYLKLKLTREFSKNAEERQRIDQQIEEIRKLIDIHFSLMPIEFVDSHFICKVLTAFGLFKNQPSYRQLYHQFENKRKKVDSALAILKKKGFIEERGTHLIIKNTTCFFMESENGFSHINFIKEALNHSKESVSHWFEKSDLARFNSFILSVKKEEYQQYISHLRQQVIKDLSRLETKDGDMLIDFHLQVYPSQRVYSDDLNT